MNRKKQIKHWLLNFPLFPTKCSERIPANTAMMKDTRRPCWLLPLYSMRHPPFMQLLLYWAKWSVYHRPPQGTCQLECSSHLVAHCSQCGCEALLNQCKILGHYRNQRVCRILLEAYCMNICIAGVAAFWRNCLSSTIWLVPVCCSVSYMLVFFCLLSCTFTHYLLQNKVCFKASTSSFPSVCPVHVLLSR